MACSIYHAGVEVLPTTPGEASGARVIDLANVWLLPFATCLGNLPLSSASPPHVFHATDAESTPHIVPAGLGVVRHTYFEAQRREWVDTALRASIITKSHHRVIDGQGHSLHGKGCEMRNSMYHLSLGSSEGPQWTYPAGPYAILVSVAAFWMWS